VGHRGGRSRALRPVPPDQYTTPIY